VSRNTGVRSVIYHHQNPLEFTFFYEYISIDCLIWDNNATCSSSVVTDLFATKSLNGSHEPPVDASEVNMLGNILQGHSPY
jgi:hypothetical protein